MKLVFILIGIGLPLFFGAKEIPAYLAKHKHEKKEDSSSDEKEKKEKEEKYYFQLFDWFPGPYETQEIYPPYKLDPEPESPKEPPPVWDKPEWDEFIDLTPKSN